MATQSTPVSLASSSRKWFLCSDCFPQLIQESDNLSPFVVKERKVVWVSKGGRRRHQRLGDVYRFNLRRLNAKNEEERKSRKMVKF